METNTGSTISVPDERMTIANLCLEVEYLVTPFRTISKQDIINDTWFRAVNDDGMMLKSVYNSPGIPLPAIALVQAAVSWSYFAQ